MPEIIVKPQNKEVDVQVCIPVYKREEELLELYDSISSSLDGLNYNIYFLLNGAADNVKQLVFNKFSELDNSGIVIFDKNIKDDVFVWPFFNLPKGLFWVIGDDDFVTENARDVIKKAQKYDLTILNYDLYDSNLKNKLSGDNLGRYFTKVDNEIDIKYVYSNLSEKLSFISSVIVNSSKLSIDYSSSEPKSFQYASLIYNSFSKSKRKASIFFEKKICLKQRGNNIPLKHRSVTDNIFINELRAFYISMMRNPLFRFAAIRKLIKATFIETPRLLIRSKIENRSANVKSFFFIDFVYFFIIKLFINIIPVQFFKLLRGFLR
tara:strand:+ start:1275 stop:2240 length:966 start_codon:yes stop_codon:yes gene_type:complete